MQREGTIVRSLSGFYTVRAGEELLTCRARGLFRKDGLTPLVGDRVRVEAEGAEGTIQELLPRKNAFSRPAVANVDTLVMVVSAAIPVTDPYLIDRMAVRCEQTGCGVVLAVNKCDLDPAEYLQAIYAHTGYGVYPVSAATGQGVDILRRALAGRLCCFTGNSGVGKSSLLNQLCPDLALPTGEVSRSLGRGRHTTRHVELYDLGNGILAADTPGFSSFGEDLLLQTKELPGLFPEFRPFLGQCRFDDCTHRSEPECAVRSAPTVHPSRYASYLRLYEEAARVRPWEVARKAPRS